MIAENDAVRRVALGHKQAVVADYGFFAIGSTKVNSRKFTDDGAIADFNIAYRSFAIFEILRLHAYQGIRKYLAVFANGGMAVDSA